MGGDDRHTTAGGRNVREYPAGPIIAPGSDAAQSSSTDTGGRATRIRGVETHHMKHGTTRLGANDGSPAGSNTVFISRGTVCSSPAQATRARQGHGQFLRRGGLSDTYLL